MFEKLFKNIRQPKSADAGRAPVAPPKGKVLVVDDDPIVCRLLNVKLTDAGYQMLEAPDGSTALTLAGQENPDIVIVDIHLAPEPGMTWDGFKLMNWLPNAQTGVRPPRFIVISADDYAVVRDQALAAGAAGFFQKPLDMPALLATLETLVATHSQPGVV